MKPRILVVDNRQDFAEDLKRMSLEPAGLDVLIAASEEEAKAILSKELIHLAIVDLRLSEEDDEEDLSGRNFCADLDTFVARIVHTAFPEWPIVRELLAERPGKGPLADGVIFKGERAEELVKEVKRVLGARFEVLPSRRIAVVTSGGDSPGMNSAIRAVVRSAMAEGMEVLGVENGYEGLLDDRVRVLGWAETSGWASDGGTALGSARPMRFKDKGARAAAVSNLIKHHVDGLVVIGGDGSMQGAAALAEDVRARGASLSTVGIPGTIDNDLEGTEMSLGADSAANAMIDEIRHMKPPASAMGRVFVVEVMGALCGYLALQTAVGCCADAVLIPEEIVQVEDPKRPGEDLRARFLLNETMDEYRKRLNAASERLRAAWECGERYGFVVVAEAFRRIAPEAKWLEVAAQFIEAEIAKWEGTRKPDVRTQELGYPVRGVPAGRFDLWLGAVLGDAAVRCLVNGRTEKMVGWFSDGGIQETDFAVVVSGSRLAPGEKWAKRPGWQRTLEVQNRLATRPW